MAFTDRDLYEYDENETLAERRAEKTYRGIFGRPISALSGLCNVGLKEEIENGLY